MRLKFFNPDENRERKNLLVELLPAGQAGIPIAKRIGISGFYSLGLYPEIGFPEYAGPWGSYQLIIPKKLNFFKYSKISNNFSKKNKCLVNKLTQRLDFSILVVSLQSDFRKEISYLRRILQGRVKFPTGGKVRDPDRFTWRGESLKLRHRQYSLDGRRKIR